MNNSDHLFSVLTREGVLINVSVRYWRVQKKVRPEDLGLDGDSVSASLASVTNGCCHRTAFIERRRAQGLH
jgi:hypothetical protein